VLQRRTLIGSHQRGLLTRMTSELQRQCSDITDRLAPPTDRLAPHSGRVPAAGTHAGNCVAVKLLSAHTQQLPMVINYLHAKCTKEQLHTQKPQHVTQHRRTPEQEHDLALAQRLRHAPQSACQLARQLVVFQLLQAGRQVLPQQVHLPPEGVASADQLQDWQIHVQDVEEQQVSQRAQRTQVRLDVAGDGRPQGLACSTTGQACQPCVT
jgi:hypothetical protein